MSESRYSASLWAGMDSGAEVVTWPDLVTVWANVRSTGWHRGVESTVDQVVAVISHSVLIRYRAGLA